MIRFDRTLRGSEQALRYAAFRSEDVKGCEPNIVDDRTNSSDVQAFAHSLDDSVSRHHSAAKAYHTVFSQKRPDFERAGMDDWREVVREVTQGYELETGRRLHWIANNHENRERPHCHVIIKATYTAQDGRERKLYLNRREVERPSWIGSFTGAHRLVLKGDSVRKVVNSPAPTAPTK